MSRTARALVVDDEPDIRELLSMTLDMMDIEATTAAGVSEAKAALSAGRFDLCLTDMRMQDGDGLDLVRWMQLRVPDVPVAMITAHGSVETAVQALKLGAFDFISKPLDIANLRNVIKAAVNLRGSEDTQRQTSLRLLGRSAAMVEVQELIFRVARSQAPVHICGESGTGKELVARMIHDAGPRAGGPFVPVNCGAIPSELMESELFGHKKGSFTGAVADKDGLMVAADGGTLFLDEIADLPLAMQVKLLRVIQEKTVRPVGESRERKVDVRILSATHQRLAERVKTGDFREDLFYRINVIELAVPPLRERDDDVLLLAESFLARFAQRLQAGEFVLADDARAALLNYPFPGNVRELENILERAVTLSAGSTIAAADLSLPSAADDPAAESAAAKPAADSSAALGEQLEDVERQAIVDALEQTRYNKTAAAKLLGLTFRQLRYRIKKLGIES